MTGIQSDWNGGRAPGAGEIRSTSIDPTADGLWTGEIGGGRPGSRGSL
ncbi:hypothetical protein [Planctomonas deserti]|nr:hypothetical protein [Planctomonas deserti]